MMDLGPSTVTGIMFASMLVLIIMGAPLAFALMISGAFVALLVRRYGTDRLRADVATPSDWRLPRVWDLLVRWLVPAQAVVLLGWWMWQATTTGFVGEGGHWYDPLNPYSLMTCLVQWGVVLVALVLLNGWMTRRLAATDA